MRNNVEKLRDIFAVERNVPILKSQIETILQQMDEP